MINEMERIKNLDDGHGPLIALVAVPIGNDKDISERARDILENADLICCEDTRTTEALLKRLGIRYRGKMESLYSQIEGQKAKSIINRIKGTESLVAYCSDAGTPGISDPGALLAKEAIDNGIRVTSIPGCSAVISALIVSGLDTADFAFYGFLSDKKGARRKKLEELSHCEIPMVFYEAPGRIVDTLTDMYEVLGDRKFALLRELTKPHEEAIRGTLKEVTEIEPESIRGECVIVVDGFDKKSVDSKADIEKLYRLYKSNDLSSSLIVRLIVAQTGIGKNQVYKIVKELDSEGLVI